MIYCRGHDLVTHHPFRSYIVLNMFKYFFKKYFTIIFQILWLSQVFFGWHQLTRPQNIPTQGEPWRPRTTGPMGRHSPDLEQRQIQPADDAVELCWLKQKESKKSRCLTCVSLKFVYKKPQKCEICWKMDPRLATGPSKVRSCRCSKT